MIVMLARTVIRNINHTCRINHIPTFLPYVTLIPLGYLITRSLTSISKPQPPRRMPPIPKKEDEIFSHINSDSVNSEKVITLINENPGRLLAYDRRGRLPLHVICQQSFPDRTVLRAIIKTCPGAVSTTDKFFSALPLHMAVHRDSQDLEVLMDLIEEFPEALMTADGGGFAPLHRAIHRKDPDMKVVKLLLDCAPNSIQIKTTNGNLPLHWVVSQDLPSLPLVKMLYDLYPGAIHVSNEKDSTPLDILMESKSTKHAALDYIVQNLQ